MRTNVDIVIEGDRIGGSNPTTRSSHGNRHRRGEPDRHARADRDSLAPFKGVPYGAVLGKIWLAWGITTVRNPATNPYEALEEIESVESGRRPGPRLLSAGDPFDGTRIYYPGGLTLDGGVQLTEQLARAQAFGYDFVKRPCACRSSEARDRKAHRYGMPVTSTAVSAQSPTALTASNTSG